MHRAVFTHVPSLLALNGYDDRGAAISSDASGFRISAEQRGAGGAAGGDFYTLAVRAHGHISIVIGDACGRGPEGRAQLAHILPRVRELALSGETPARLLAELNRTAIAELSLDSFVTATALELDVRAGVLTVANAAHVPPLVRRAGRVSVVGLASGPPLGFSAAANYVDEHRSLKPRDVIVLMTDGVLEAVEADLTAMSTFRASLTDTTFDAAAAHRMLLLMFEKCTIGCRADDMTLLAIEPVDQPRPAKLREMRYGRFATLPSVAA